MEKLIDRLVSHSRFDKKHIQIISKFGDHPLFIDVMVQQIKHVLESDGGEQYKDVLLSPHSIPMKRIKKGDPYKAEIEQAYNLIKQKLPDDIKMHLAYQSKLGPVEWLGPATPDKIEELAKDGIKNLLVYPLGFVADNSETIYEIGMLYKDLAVEKGITNFKRVDALNTDVNFINAMKEIIINH
jgi:ferrochelatase